MQPQYQACRPFYSGQHEDETKMIFRAIKSTQKLQNKSAIITTFPSQI
jgi:hypothetical protein